MAASFAHFRCVAGPSQSLSKIFLSPVDCQAVRYAAHHIPQRQTRYYNFAPRPSPTPRPGPAFRNQRPPPSTPATSYGPQSKNEPIKDEQITARRIQIVDEAGGLQPPMLLRDALGSFDRGTHFLVQVAPETAVRPAVCKITSKESLRERLRAKAKPVKPAGHATKQLELNWGIEEHDLAHRLKLVQSYFDKGKKVEFILLKKDKKKKPATPEKARELVRTIKTKLVEMGAVETKKMEGALLGRFTIYAEKPQEAKNPDN
ncbi:hypothetical protein FQN50_000747 [Emmonsiellopsis sp. PD_5]|nr:hypothetical protein FQN50_000747 [Emmonsiellopsis sp. PD_5]